MLSTTKQFVKFLEKKDIRFTHYEATEKRREIIKVGFKGENKDGIEVLFFFDPSEKAVGVKCFSIAKVPEAKLANMYALLNNLNGEYRWVKFYIDDENEVTASSDATITKATADEVCYDRLLRFLDIVDEVYPQIMKTLWS